MSDYVTKTAFDSLQAKRSAVSLGYSQLVVRNENLYRDILLRATGDWKLRRQTPLINAGYAIRVLAVSHAIDGFVQFHRHFHPKKKIQIVFFGCGVDIIGVWSHSLRGKAGQTQIVELDMPSVCKTKKEFLLSKDLVVEGKDSAPLEQILIGRIAVEDSQSTAPDYVLSPIDLRDTSALNQLLDAGRILNPLTVPTLAVSELVLAYLTPKQTDRLLSWCSTELIKASGSAMVTLEPLGCDKDTQSAERTPPSVSEGYRRDFCHLFQGKMDKGKSVTTKIQRPEEPNQFCFNPIGTSGQTVRNRFRCAGFGYISVATLGAAAAHASNGANFRIPEIFDEHAALALHLRSYVVSTAFNNDSDPVLLRFMCPSDFAASEIAPTLKQNVVFTVLERMDEVAMRRLFRETYSHLFDAYPAIRKMVNGVLNSEFALSEEWEDQTNKSSQTTARYKAQGGCFFVAIRYHKEDGPEREIVGCVGVRPSERRDDPGTLEVFRLAVRKDYRGKGIGRQLLQMVESFARKKASPKLIANTLTCLESALLTYEACGYKVERDYPIGYLTMRMFVRQL